ncbi:GDNF family receptor alpha-like [Scomber japonicus]|uniref:GDNF family receptor alpha-like n=1 Tax=Scomber japonicus TaxID=13676 RepID=UPI0023056C35|nr:GDNF family receptor alpha-like [Scomber japonicus]
MYRFEITINLFIYFFFTIFALYFYLYFSGFVIPQISSLNISSTPSDCWATVDTCMSDLCKIEKAFYGGTCDDERCQIKGSEVCDMTIRTILDQFPSLQGCVCAWEEELCGSIQVLATQCHQKPAAQQKRSTVVDWKSSSLINYVYDGTGSCMEQIRVCVSDAVCNRYLVPVLQACRAEGCNRDHCLQATQQFYGSMPHNIAEMLVMCDCRAADQSCLHMKTALQSGTCGEETWICQETVDLCIKDRRCRNLLKTFQAKCWSSEEAQCSDFDLQNECFTQMDPTFIFGEDSECKRAFFATLGTTLHYPCTCKGVHNAALLTCNLIHDAFHNRSHFMRPWKSNDGPSKPPEINEPEKGQTHISDYLLYGFSTVLLVGVVILMPLAVISTIWVLRRKDRKRFHPPQKNKCVVIL